jgi:protein SCO1
MRRIVLFLLILIFSCFDGKTQDIPVATSGDLGIFEHPGRYIDTSLRFVNEQGDTVALSQVIDKPTALLLVFYRCRGICSPLMDGVAKVISQSDLTLGKEYQVLNISFNPREDAQLAREKKRNYVAQITKKVDEHYWMFFTGDSLSIQSITDSVGFKYLPNGPDDYIHAAAVIMLSPDGKITRYLMGTEFLPFDFKMAVVEANAGRPGPTINKVLQYCFNYDPDGRRYVFNITKVAGTVIFLFIGIFMAWLFFSKRNRSKQSSTETQNSN